MFLCWGCLHPFPESNLRRLHINSDLKVYFESVRTTIDGLNDIKPQSARLKKHTAALLDAYNLLVEKVDKEIVDLTQNLALMKEKEKDVDLRAACISPILAGVKDRNTNQASPPSSPNCRIVKPQRNKLPSAPPKMTVTASPDARPPEKTPVPYMISKGKRFVAKVRSQPDARPVLNRFGKEVYNVHMKEGVKWSAMGTNVVTAQVMGSLYLALESVVSRVNAQRGILWCRVQGGSVSELGDELVGAIVIEPDQGAAAKIPPMRIGVTQGVVGASVCSNIAINISPAARGQTGGDNADGDTAVISEAIAEKLVKSMHLPEDDDAPPEPPPPEEGAAPTTMLVLPIPMKFKSFSQTCIGALQLFHKTGSASGAYFTEADEVAALSATHILSHLLSNYKPILSGSTKKVFDPSALVSSGLSGGINSGQQGGHDTEALPAAISSHFPPLLVHRTTDTGFITKSGLLRANKEIAVHGRVKEIERFQGTLEVAWKQSVASLTECESKKQALAAVLNDVRDELHTLRQEVKTHRQNSMSASHPNARGGPNMYSTFQLHSPNGTPEHSYRERPATEHRDRRASQMGKDETFITNMHTSMRAGSTSFTPVPPPPLGVRGSTRASSARRISFHVEDR